MGRRLGAGTSRTLDWRLLAIGGILVLGVVILLLILLFGGGGTPEPGAGVRQVNAGRATSSRDPGDRVHLRAGHIGPALVDGDSPGPWGVYTNAQPRSG